MKKLIKFLVSIVAVGAAIAGAYYVVKNFLLKDRYEDIDDFDDIFDDDFDEDFDDGDEVPVTMETTEDAQE